MEWSWTIYFVLFPLCVVLSMFSRGFMNAQNIAKYGREADYNRHPLLAISGSLLGGGIWAAIFTAVIGFFL